jgi:PAS domain S-box-containing protein
MQQHMSEQQQIEIELEQRNEDLAVLTSVINTINQSSTLQNVLTTTLVKIENLLGLGHGEIWLSDELTHQLTLIASRPLPGSLAREKQIFEFDQGLPGLIAGSRQPLFIADLSNSPDLQARIEQFNFTCALGIPLVAREALTGVMIFFSVTPSDFSPQIVSQLAIIGHLIGTAIQNAYLYTNLQQRQDTRLFEKAQREIAERKQIEEKLARQAREMVLLDQIRMAVAREVDLPAVLKKMVEAIANIFGYTLVSVYLLQNNNLILQHQVGYHKPRRKIPLAGRIRGEVIDSKKPTLVKDDQATPEFSFEYEKITSRVCVPLFDQTQMIGILNVESLDGHYLGEADLRLMTTLSEYINIAIERANLFAEARGNEEKYNTLIEQSNDAIYLIYGNRFEMVNRKFRELFGVTQKELNDPNFAFTNIVAPKSRKLVIEQSKLERGRQGEAAPKVSPIYEFTALDKDGKEIEVELSVSYPTYKGGLATQGVLRDITERKRVEAEQATFQAQMFHSAKLASIGELAAGVAHEINNPIFSIREFADLILEDTAKDAPAYSMLETIIREANRIADIVRNLLEFSRPSETNLNPIQLQNVWELVYKLVGQSFYKQNIQLEVDIPKGLPLIKARGQQLQQVLLNLLMNARDALLEKYPGSQKHPEKRVTISARRVENAFALTYPDGQEIAEAIILTVRDEGIGISSENQEHLFTPFFTTKRPKSGSGLGLSICHKIVEEHHGRIEVESEEGKFTEFRIILPLIIE